VTELRRLTWVGHSTVIIELDGVRLMTDPLLRRRVMHLFRSGPAPELVDVDAIAVSHAHWDHLDLRSLRLVEKDKPVIAPRGLHALLRNAGFTQIVELEVGESFGLGLVEIEATHAEHDLGWPRRSRAAAIGFVIRGSQAVYFPGDTDLFDAMADLGADGLDVALLPIAGWGPALPPGHLNARTAADALRLLRPRIAVPIHWGTYSAPGFRRRWAAAPDEFRSHAAKIAPEVTIEILAPGESLDF
jgi:L-ascorbate metabolism protein UlaG (beta-lactamase superfamily)